MLPRLPMPSFGPPWELTSVRVSTRVVDAALWLAEITGGLGIAAGLLAAARGARPPMRLIVVAAVIVVAALTVLPPAGSTDALDYAAYGRLLALGHNPYVITPSFLRDMHNSFAQSVPREWETQVSLYGPFATLEQFVAAKLGGASAARIVLWLKLWNGLAYAAVAIVLDRLVRSDPAQRLRAHLLWTLNPLLLWDLLAAGHVDMLAAAAGLGGLLAIGRQQGTSGPRLWRALVAGALIGISADIKINYILLGLGLAWALRRSKPALLTAAAGGLAVLVPTYAWLGAPAARALLARRDKASADSFYRIFTLDNGLPPHLVILAVVFFVGLAWLLLRRMPAGDRLRPALRPALIMAIAWLFIWPYQLPWYDAIFICVLVLYPATRLDWLVLLRLTAATLANTPGIPAGPPGHDLKAIDRFSVNHLGPWVLLLSAVGLVVVAATGRWKIRYAPRLAVDDGRPPAGPSAGTGTGTGTGDGADGGASTGGNGNGGRIGTSLPQPAAVPRATGAAKSSSRPHGRPTGPAPASN
jgi:hypothetical protein